MAPFSVQRDASPLPPHTAACMGAFDGFHRGHRALFEVARERCPHVAAVTFEPHPLQVLAPERAPQLLQSPVQRMRVAEACGLERLVLLPFDRKLATLDADAFVRRFLLDGLHPEVVVVGADFRFGAGRAGTPEELRDRLAAHGIATAIVPPIPHPFAPDRKLSSTDVRRAVADGDVELAGTLLGRWHSVAGRVVAGAQRGRDLGYPTANIACPGAFLPSPGIYATALTVWDPTTPLDGRCWPSVASLGRNPTFVADGPLTLEVHVLGEDLGTALYDAEVEVSFIRKLRDEAKFPDAPSLVRQIERDILAAQACLTPAAMELVLRPTREGTP